MKENIGCSLSGRFKLWEKIYAQFSFIAMSVIGTIGIAVVDWRWMLPYILINWYGIPGIIMRHLNCPRCPHLHEYGDCLQAPPGLSKWLIKTRKTSPFSASEKLLFYMIFILIPAYPIYWLFSNKVLLILFVLMAGLWYSGQFLYFCKRCRVYDCPLNQVKLTH